jgi:2-phosphosulfolactate phosphatase
MSFDQSEFDHRCEWGEPGIASLCNISDVVVIVDALCFSTCVEIATARGAAIFPHRWGDGRALEFAHKVGAELAGPRGKGGYSLSPGSFLNISAGQRVVLPSPNGASLSLITKGTKTLTGCLRNAAAVARTASKVGSRVAVIPAGERWPDGTLRPCLEDLLGAGAILDRLPGSLSPEAEAAVKIYQAFRHHLRAKLYSCGSGKELIEWGFEQDIILASELNVSDCVPMLVDNAYVDGKE